MTRVYYFTSAKWGLFNIEHQQLKASSIKNLNDPFDCFVHIITPERTDYSSARDNWHDKLGMICFSRNYRNPVQWSHYADRHSGIALGFDVADEILEKVTYLETPHTVNFSDHQGTEDEWLEVRHAMTCKYIHWQYEEESRVFYELNSLKKSGDMHFKEFDDSLVLKEIILGVNSKLKDEQILKAARDYRGIDIRRANISEDAYEVRKAIFIENL